MSTATATPPRFVPTLTDVVELPDNAVPLEIAPEAALLPGTALGAFAHMPTAPTRPAQEPSPSTPMHTGLEEEVIHRVLHRVDMTLDQRLRKSIVEAVEEQISAITDRLRDEVENIVRHAVYEAVAQELAGEPAATPTPTTPVR